MTNRVAVVSAFLAGAALVAVCVVAYGPANSGPALAEKKAMLRQLATTSMLSGGAFDSAHYHSNNIKFGAQEISTDATAEGNRGWYWQAGENFGGPTKASWASGADTVHDGGVGMFGKWGTNEDPDMKSYLEEQADRAQQAAEVAKAKLAQELAAVAAAQRAAAEAAAAAAAADAAEKVRLEAEATRLAKEAEEEQARLVLEQAAAAATEEAAAKTAAAAAAAAASEAAAANTCLPGDTHACCQYFEHERNHGIHRELDPDRWLTVSRCKAQYAASERTRVYYHSYNGMSVDLAKTIGHETHESQRQAAKGRQAMAAGGAASWELLNGRPYKSRTLCIGTFFLKATHIKHKCSTRLTNCPHCPGSVGWDRGIDDDHSDNVDAIF